MFKLLGVLALQVVLGVTLGIGIAKGLDYYRDSKLPPLPQVGECFERRLTKDSDVGLEYVKVIAVNPNDKNDTIKYVYNFPGEENFKKGKWYINEHLAWDSKRWFFKEFEDFEAVKKMECPW